MLMKVSLKLSLSEKEKVIKNNYVSKMLHVIKYGLSNTDEKLFNTLYSKNKTKIFTASFKLNNVVFKNHNIVLTNDSTVAAFLSTSDISIFAAFYNAFNFLRKGTSFDNEVLISTKNIVIESTKKVKSNILAVSTVSSAVFRDTDGHSLTIEDNLADINKSLQRSLFAKLNTSRVYDKLKKEIDDVNIVQVLDHKNNVVNMFDYHFLANKVSFVLKTKSSAMMNFILENGIGSRTGEGFGMLKVIGG